jgi:hypothetical protein
MLALSVVLGLVLVRTIVWSVAALGIVMVLLALF